MRLSVCSVQVTRVSCRGPSTMTELFDLVTDKVIVAWESGHLSPASASLLFSIDCQLIAGFVIALLLDITPPLSRISLLITTAYT